MKLAVLQFDELKAARNELENDCTALTASNERDLVEFTRKQEEESDEQAKLVELTQIVEQKGTPNDSSV